LAAVQEFDWDLEVDLTRDDTYDTPGEVVRTSPEPGHDLAEGSPLLIFVSEGPEFRQVPELSGRNVDEAEAALAELRLVAGTVVEEFDESVPPGVVISNSANGVAVGGDVLPGTEVDLVVSRGPAPRVVPQMRGLTPEQATRLLEQFGLELALGEPVFDDEVPAGQIATQDPPAESEVERGATLTAFPSKGPDLVPLPDLTGMALPQINQALVDAGLNLGALLGSTQGTFVAASVGGEEVDAGEPVRRGSSVDIVILTP
jgi:serine/threonine-protein kinase